LLADGEGAEILRVGSRHGEDAADLGIAG